MLIGGGGFLGINIAQNLVQAGYYVFILDRKCQHLKQQKYLVGVMGFYDGNIADPEAIIKIIDEFSINCVINLVSTLIPSSKSEYFFSELESFTVPAFRLISLLADRGVKYVFISSGGTIYGHAESEFISETDRCEPVNIYGYSKLVFEEYVKFYGRSHGLNYLIIRPSNPYGMYQNPLRKQGFIAVAMNLLLKGEAIEIWGDGSVVRDYVSVSDLANALTLLLGKNIWNTVFNIGSGAGHSLLEILSIMDSITGQRAKIVYKEPRLIDVARIVLNVSKLKNEIEFNPISVNDGIKSYYEMLLKESSTGGGAPLMI